MGAYEKDFYAWAIEQASLLRQGRLTEIDVENVADEIESLGRSTKSELVSRLGVLIADLLKWSFQANFRSPSWRLTIEEQRDEVRSLLADNPSLKASLPDSFERAYRKALRRAVRETGLELQALQATNPWSYEQLLDDEFFPE